MHLCRTAWPAVGGMEHALGTLAIALAKRGHSVRVVSLANHPHLVPASNTLAQHGVSHLRLRALGPRSYPFAGPGLLSALQGADVVHVHALDGLLHQALALRPWHRARVGVSTHGGFLHTQRYQPLKQVVLRGITRPQLRQADAVWYTSNADRTRIGGGQVPGTVVPPPIDLSPLTSVVRNPEPGHWLVFGRVDAHKGIDDLLRMLPHTPARVRLTVLGEPANPSVAKALALQVQKLGLAGRVQLIGRYHTSALVSQLSRCEWALFPSHAEGFGIALVEAMAASVPVAVRPIPAFVEQVMHKKTGLHVDFSNPRFAAKALLAGSTLNLVKAKAHAMRFDMTQGITHWETTYRKVLAPG